MKTAHDIVSLSQYIVCPSEICLFSVLFNFLHKVWSTLSHSLTLSIDDTPLRAFQSRTWFQTILIGSSRCMRERPRVRPRYPPTSATRLKEEWERTSFETGTILLNVNSSFGFLLSDFDTRLVCISICIQGLSQVSYRG